MNFDFQLNSLWNIPGGPWLALPLWSVLTATAYIDAKTGRVPNSPLLGAALAVIATHCFLGLWISTLWNSLMALLCGALIWGANETWYRIRKHDALGMGDAKWSMLAVLAFGLKSVLWAWALASWFGLTWMAIIRLRDVKIRRLFFTPFLLAGLVAARLLLPQLLPQ